jgi:hypothetical protein
VFGRVENTVRLRLRPTLARRRRSQAQAKSNVSHREQGVDSRELRLCEAAVGEQSFATRYRLDIPTVTHVRFQIRNFNLCPPLRDESGAAQLGAFQGRRLASSGPPGLAQLHIVERYE